MSLLIFTQSTRGNTESSIWDGNMIVGNIRSRTALRLVREWATQHRDQLEAKWENAKAGRSLERIQPLD